MFKYGHECIYILVCIIYRERKDKGVLGGFNKKYFFRIFLGGIKCPFLLYDELYHSSVV